MSSSLVLSLSNSFRSPSLTVFGYHRIAPNDETPVRRVGSHMFGPDEEAFRSHVKEMKRHADPVSENDLLEFVRGRGKLPKRSFFITFDDGYRDNLERAEPILRELNVPAMFFIPTEHIETRSVGWWDLIYWALDHSEKTTIKVRNREFVLQDKEHSHVAETFLEMMKLLPFEETETLVEEIFAACDVRRPTLEEQCQELLTWEEIKQAKARGIGIGSHTHTHRVLSTLDLKAQEEELVRSKEMLEKVLGEPVRSLAFPVGGYEHFHSETMEIARKTGYELSFSFLTGINEQKNLNPFDIKRVDYERDLEIYQGVFGWPSLFARRGCKLESPRSPS